MLVTCQDQTMSQSVFFKNSSDSLDGHGIFLCLWFLSNNSFLFLKLFITASLSHKITSCWPDVTSSFRWFWLFTVSMNIFLISKCIILLPTHLSTIYHTHKVMTYCQRAISLVSTNFTRVRIQFRFVLVLHFRFRNCDLIVFWGDM